MFLPKCIKGVILRFSPNILPTNVSFISKIFFISLLWPARRPQRKDKEMHTSFQNPWHIYCGCSLNAEMDGRGERIAVLVLLQPPWREWGPPCDSGQLGLMAPRLRPGVRDHADWPLQLHPIIRPANTPAHRFRGHHILYWGFNQECFISLQLIEELQLLKKVWMENV